MKTVFPNVEKALSERKWFVVDAAGQTVGRLASNIAQVLRGKNNPMFTPSADTGDFVVVLNAGKVKFTGNKLKQKLYHHHTGFIGNLKETSAEKLLASHPERVIISAVRGMLPKNPLGRQQLSKLKVYSGESHPHEAQNPVVVSF